MATQTRASLIFLLTLTTSLVNHTQCRAQGGGGSKNYAACEPFTCGNITFTFPFSSAETFGLGPIHCGLPRFQVACDLTYGFPTVNLSGRPYQVTQLFSYYRLVTVVDYQLIKELNLNTCASLRNLTIPTISDDDFTIPQFGVNLTVFKCPNGVSLSSSYRILGNHSCSEGYEVYFRNETDLSESGSGPVETPGGCEYLAVPVSAASLLGNGSLNLVSVLRNGFSLQWPDLDGCTNCQNTGGQCGYDGSSGTIVCLCQGLKPNLNAQGGCQHKSDKSNKWKVIAGAAAGSSFALLAVVLLLLVFRNERRISAIFKPYHMTGDERNVKELVEKYQSTLLANYSYKDIKKMTNGFTEKLGEGGFGVVFKGRMSDGRLIAVKMIENYKDNSQNFLNEVTTIGMIHHVNVIRLLGFCWDGSKKALIYEYMPNKSLGDMMANGETSISLGLTRLLEIAIGVAHGIEYLHIGCDSRILHLDIKPQNVLLDQDLNPKISDFGLAKVYSRNQSAVTMTGARGTIGYIAPEVFMRNLGNPSHKSDVYSFGMLLLEMVGENRRVQPDVISTTSEAYFPNWIYDKLIEEREIELKDSVLSEEVHISRKMVMVGLWCIQMNPRDRPSMTQVVEMLSGNIEAIAMPPKPMSFSPPRLPLELETTSIESESSDLHITSGSHEI